MFRVFLLSIYFTQDYGAVDYLRLRVIPVLGTSPSIFGQALASYVLCMIGKNAIQLHFLFHSFLLERNDFVFPYVCCLGVCEEMRPRHIYFIYFLMCNSNVSICFIFLFV